MPTGGQWSDYQEGGSGGGGYHQKKHMRRGKVFNRALQQVAAGLEKRGIDAAVSGHMAKLILSRPGVVITPKGVRYHDKKFTYGAFAHSPLASLISGIRAKKQNQAALESEPGYMQALAELGLQRDLQTAGLAEQRSRSILDFGDPLFAGRNRLLGAQAAANPFSTARLLERARDQSYRQVTDTANRAGTLFGGGYQSGRQEAERVSGARQFDATRSLEDLLTSLDRQKAQAQQIYQVGKSGALQGASQRLLAAGIHSAKAPTGLKVRPFELRLPWRRPGHRVVSYAP